MHESDRGGQATYHGPGQLVGYPIVDLKPDRRDVRRYVRDLEEVLILTLADYGVAGEPALSPRPVGVWVGERKIASLGIHLRHWVTTHGFALNVTTDLSFFSGIVACGMQSAPMTSIEELAGTAPALEEVARRVVLHFADVFGRAPAPLSAAEIDGLTGGGRCGSRDRARWRRSVKRLAVGLNAAIFAVTDEQPRLLTVEDPRPQAAVDSAGEPALPFGRLDPEGDRTLELGLRGWVREQTGLELGYVEQLYTFGDRDRHLGADDDSSRVLSIAYLALVREHDSPSLEEAHWRDVYELLPWEDWRGGRPAADRAVPVAEAARVGDARRRRCARQRRERVEIAFGLGGARWDDERVLDRYELLYEAGLLREARRDVERPERHAARKRRRGPRRRARRQAGAVDGARPPPDRRHRARPAARQAQVPPGGVRAAAALLHPAPAPAGGRGAGRHPPAQAELPATGRDRRAWSRAPAGWTPAPAAARPSCSPSAARCCASGRRPGVGLPGVARLSDALITRRPRRPRRQRHRTSGVIPITPLVDRPIYSRVA